MDRIMMLKLSDWKNEKSAYLETRNFAILSQNAASGNVWDQPEREPYADRQPELQIQL